MLIIAVIQRRFWSQTLLHIRFSWKKMFQHLVPSCSNGPQNSVELIMVKS